MDAIFVMMVPPPALEKEQGGCRWARRALAPWLLAAGYRRRGIFGGMLSPGRGRGSVVLLALVLVALVGAAHGQDGFRIIYDVDRSRPDRARITGRVANERSDEIFEVNVTAEALDSRGKVVARGIAYVDSRIPGGDSRPFSVTVPTPAGASNFRVVVSSYRAGYGQQGP
jgi:hypothetical protein